MGDEKDYGGTLADAGTAPAAEPLHAPGPVMREPLMRTLPQVGGMADAGDTLADGAGATGSPPCADGDSAQGTLADAGSSGDVGLGTSGAGLLAEAVAGDRRGASVPRAAAPAARDRYQIVHTIGEGGMGAVWLARDPALNRWIAVKRLKPRFAGDSRVLERFRSEARSVGSLFHANIVAVFAMAEDNEGPYIAMEYVAGPKPWPRDGASGPASTGERAALDMKGAPAGWGADLPNSPMTLEQKVARDGPLGIPEVLGLGIQLCSAVAHAHRQGIIHRDIKPANVLINEEGQPKLADFGIAARRAADNGDDDHGDSESGTLVGARLLTLGYGAPEQEADSSRVDERADLFSIGATLWFALTGQSPRHFRESEVPGALRPVLVEALQKDREKRIATARQFAQRLERLDAGARRASRLETEDHTIAPGTCAECGHRHAIDAADPLARRFCENCGSGLVMTCLKCAAANGVWAKFCGGCGADLDALARNAAAALRADRDELLPRLRKEGQYQEAINRLERAAALDHPQLAELADWARRTLPDWRADFEAAARQRDTETGKAERYLAAFDYREAIKALESIPRPLWTADYEQLYAKATSLQGEVMTLRDEIRGQVRVGRTAGLKPKVLRFLELQPEDEGAKQLLARLQRREAEVRDELWHAVDRGRSIELCRQYLGAHPDGPHVRQVRAILAPMLREKVLERPADVKLREEYLACRTEALAREDEKHAFQGVALGHAAWGMAGGAAVGAAIGGIGGAVGGFIGGILGGVATAFLAGRRNR